MSKFKMLCAAGTAAMSFLVTFSLSGSSGDDSGKILFQQDFCQIDSLEEAGWKIKDSEHAFSWKTGKDGLILKFRNKPYNGGGMSHPVPMEKNEELTLDLTIGASYTNYHHFSLRFEFENTLFAFKNYLGGHMLLRHSPKNNRWTTISGEVPLGKRTTIRITSHKTDKGRTLQYFIDDMDSPVFFEEGIDDAPTKDGKASINISNYGLSLSEVSHRIYSISLRALPDAESGGSIELLKGSASYFMGIAYERYRIPEIMKELGLSNVQTYAITNKAPALTARNTFRIDRIPPLNAKSIKEYIFMVDFPLNKGLVPASIVEGIKREVREGSTLVILGGLSTLNKGEFQSSELREIVPLDMSDPWAVSVLQDCEIFPGGRLRYIHKLLPDNANDVVSTANGNPLWVIRNYGKGRVVVFLGMPCGTSPQGLFCGSEKWPSYAAGVISGKSIK